MKNEMRSEIDSLFFGGGGGGCCIFFFFFFFFFELLYSCPVLGRMKIKIKPQLLPCSVHDSSIIEDAPLVEFMYFAFTRTQGESKRWRFRSLSLCLCDVRLSTAT